ncbi:MAG: MOSC N-terminal beta barrel domain-containing protein [Polyangiaceae bacterium]
MARVSALYVYPIKACRGIRLSEWAVAARGFEADRRWMIVDMAGNFVTQREMSELSQVETSLLGDSLRISTPGFSPLELPRSYDSGTSRTVQVWRDQVVTAAHPEGSAWFSQFLRAPHELVYMPDAELRHVNPEAARAGDIVSFADGYPFLLISEASLTDLNSRLAEPITMDRFRPNIVVTDTAPFAEDEYNRVRLGEISFRGVKRCERCVVTNVDPLTGERGREPLRTLASYRLEDQKIWFGMNLIHEGTGVLRVGDAVQA